jgi:hypothetical protein
MNNITLTVELGPESRAKLDKILAALPATDPGATQKAAAAAKLTDLELADVLLYCVQLARLVSPNDARKHFGFTFDGAVIDTLRGMAMLYAGEVKTGDDFKRNELYGPTLRQMMDDIHEYLGPATLPF